MLKEYSIPTSAAARACLEIAGGGLTVHQTAKAIEWQRTLLETGELKAGGYHLKLKDFKVPETVKLTVPCGGCGNSDPDKRCLGCHHPF